MIIQCGSLDQLIAVIIGLTKEGMQFKAEAHTLTIELTGGF
jgi:hypothetical protein